MQYYVGYEVITHDVMSSYSIYGYVTWMMWIIDCIVMIMKMNFSHTSGFKLMVYIKKTCMLYYLKVMVICIGISFVYS